MNYLLHYNKLIERAKTRKLETYKEKHHIIPRCIGGTDAKENLVELTAREHFVAHQLLIKIYPEEASLVYAARMICVDRYGNRVSNRLYSWLKEKYSEKVSEQHKGNSYTKGRKLSKEHCEKLSIIAKERLSVKENHPMFGKKHSEETKEKIRQKHLGVGIGRKHTEETKQKIRDSLGDISGENHPCFGKKHSDETKKKIGQQISGRKYMNNGIETKAVKPEDIETYLQNGFSFGVLRKN
jgi:hypothetical protein